MTTDCQSDPFRFTINRKLNLVRVQLQLTMKSDAFRTHIYHYFPDNLVSYIFNQSDIKVDIRASAGKAALVSQRLNSIWFSHSNNSTVKFRLYTSIVLSTALHACKTWKSTASIRNTLDVFHRRCIQKIL